MLSMGSDVLGHLEQQLQRLAPTDQVSSLLWLPRETRAWLLPSFSFTEVVWPRLTPYFLWILWIKESRDPRLILIHTLMSRLFDSQTRLCS